MVAVQPRHPDGLRLCLIGESAVWRAERQVTAAEVGSRKARTLLKLLAAERGRWIRVDRIAEVLWADDVPIRPGDNVATLVSRLRATLGHGIIDGDRGGYRLGGGVDVDLAIATRHLVEARQRVAAGEPTLVAASAARARQLLGDGVALTEECDADWAQAARTEAVSLLREARHLGARAALAIDEPAVARDLAEAATTADPYDEMAHRLLMRAEAELGEPARALGAYERLRTLLATELGVDPAPETRELHVAILRAEATPTTNETAKNEMARNDTAENVTAENVTAATVTAENDTVKKGTPGEPLSKGAATRELAATPPEARSAVVGRELELARLTECWCAAAGGSPALLLISGEAGIGKTRLAGELVDLAARTGGQVLSARCYETERSLLLQPVVEALGRHAARANPDVLRAAARDWAEPLAALVPEIGAILDRPPEQHDRGDVTQRRAYEAIARYVHGLASAPMLLFFDDLHHAGVATVGLLHYLIRQAGGAKLLIVATIRAEEGASVHDALADVAERIDLGPLSAAAVRKLASAAGHGDLADGIVTRTRGHTLFVVETLRALATDKRGIPESLQAAVMTRVRRTGVATENLLRAAAVVGASIEPETLARMLDIPIGVASSRCEQAMDARLLVVAGRAYEFANDLIREVVYGSMPAPTQVAYHRRAADLLVDRPEAVGAHACAAGDLVRAARAWLLAGEQALARGAAADARSLLSSAIDAASEAGDREIEARIYLARGRAHDALTAYPAAFIDFGIAADMARTIGDRRLEMSVLRELGGDVTVQLGQPLSLAVANLHAGLRIAESLGDRATESDLLARLAVNASARLAFNESIELGGRAVRAARASGEDRALAAALDGLKTGYAYLGEIALLAPIIVELEPLLRRQGDLWRLPWTVEESSFSAIAAGRWDEALERIAAAHDINRRSGYAAYEGWFVGQLAWVHRLRGDLEQSLVYGRRALDLTGDSRHAWWRPAACAQLAAALLATGERDAGIALLSEGRELANHAGAEGYRLRCIAPLAEATGDRRLLDEADELLSAIDAPAGSAWLLGAEAYLSIGRAWLDHGEPKLALATVTPLRAAAARTGWVWIDRAARELIDAVSA